MVRLEWRIQDLTSGDGGGGFVNGGGGKSLKLLTVEIKFIFKMF